MSDAPEQKVDTHVEAQPSAPKAATETPPAGQTDRGQLLGDVRQNLDAQGKAKLDELNAKKGKKVSERDALVTEANAFRQQETWVNNAETPGLGGDLGDQFGVIPQIDQKVEENFKLQEADLNQFGLPAAAIDTLKQAAKSIIFEHYKKNGRNDNTTSEYTEKSLVPKLQKLFEGIKKIYDGGGHPYKSAVEMLGAFSKYTGLNFFHDNNFDANQVRQLVLLVPTEFDKFTAGFEKYALTEKDIASIDQEIAGLSNKPASPEAPAATPQAAPASPETPAAAPAATPQAAPTATPPATPPSTPTSAPPSTPSNAPASAPAAAPQAQSGKFHTGIGFLDTFLNFFSGSSGSSDSSATASSGGGSFFDSFMNLFRGGTSNGAAEGGFLAGIFNIFKSFGKPAESRTAVAANTPSAAPTTAPSASPTAAPSNSPSQTPRSGIQALSEAGRQIVARARAALPSGTKGAEHVTSTQAQKAQELLRSNSGTYGVVGTETTSDGRTIAYVRERHGANPSVGDATHQHEHDGVSIVELPPGSAPPAANA